MGQRELSRAQLAMVSSVVLVMSEVLAFGSLLYIGQDGIVRNYSACDTRPVPLSSLARANSLRRELGRVVELALWFRVCVRRASVPAVDDISGLIPLVAWMPLVFVFLDVSMPMGGIPRAIRKTLEAASNMPTTISDGRQRGFEAFTSLGYHQIKVNRRFVKVQEFVASDTNNRLFGESRLTGYVWF